jgi:hypothetical protein
MKFFLLTLYTACLPLFSQDRSASFPGWSNLKYIIAFGDSFTRVGFTIGVSPPPTTARPLGLRLPGYSSANGPNYIAYLLGTYNAGHRVPTYDLAYGGATVSRKYVSPPSPKIFTLENQVDSYFLKNQGKISGWSRSNTLFMIWMGVNDCRLGYDSPYPSPFTKKCPSHD